jgi:hypothetical protein
MRYFKITLIPDTCLSYSFLRTWLLHDTTHIWAGRSGDRIPVGARFFAYVQTGPGAYPASYTMGIGFFPGVKRPGRGADHPPPTSAGVKNTCTPPLGLHGLL